jgi:hypothetical protein
LKKYKNPELTRFLLLRDYSWYTVLKRNKRGNKEARIVSKLKIEEFMY